MKRAVITGGSRGFGRAAATELAHRGWRVVITGRDGAVLTSAVEEIGGNVVGVRGDVTDQAHRRRVRHSAGSRIDLLINNASDLGPSPLQPIAELDSEAIRRVFDVNAIAPAAFVGELIPVMAADAIVVNVSSDAAVTAYPTWGAYGASKAALDHLSSVLAAERPGMAVYAFDPGDMRTDMHQAAFPGEDISDRPLPGSVVPALLRLIEQRPVSGRYLASHLLAGAA